MRDVEPIERERVEHSVAEGGLPLATILGGSDRICLPVRQHASSTIGSDKGKIWGGSVGVDVRCRRCILGVTQPGAS
jgi:hypothetical protein